MNDRVGGRMADLLRGWWLGQWEVTAWVGGWAVPLVN